MISSGGRSTELADIGGNKVVDDWVAAGVRRAKSPTEIGRCDGEWTKVIVGVVLDEGGVTGVLIGNIASGTTGLVRSRKEGCGHGWRARWQAVNTRRRGVSGRLGWLQYIDFNFIIRIFFGAGTQRGEGGDRRR